MRGSVAEDCLQCEFYTITNCTNTANKKNVYETKVSEFFFFNIEINVRETDVSSVEFGFYNVRGSDKNWVDLLTVADCLSFITEFVLGRTGFPL